MWASWGILAWKASLLWTPILAISLTGGIIVNDAGDTVAWSLGWIGLYGVWVAYSMWMARRQQRIQIEDGTFEETAAQHYGMVDPARKGFGSVVYGSLAAMTEERARPRVDTASGTWIRCGRSQPSCCAA
jgi:hypothetical protein